MRLDMRSHAQTVFLCIGLKALDIPLGNVEIDQNSLRLVGSFGVISIKTAKRPMGLMLPVAESGVTAMKVCLESTY